MFKTLKMKNFLSLLLVLSFFGKSHAQTWSDDVASIVYNKCSSCHHSGGIAPFSLMNYNEVSINASAIESAIISGVMPPFPPDVNYQQYAHSRVLDPADKSIFLAWLQNGVPEGNSANTPPPPVFNSGSVLGSGDLELSIPVYASKATGQDDYVCFSIPTGLTQDRVIRAMEIVPGNREIVHHCLVYADPTGSFQTDTIGGNCSGPQSGTLISGYTPGATPLIFPSGSSLKLGMTIPSGSNIVLSMHYPQGSQGMLDSTKVIFHFYPTTETGIREVSAAPVLSNWNLALPPNQVSNVTARYPANGSLNFNISLLSVFPHMHLIGKSIKAYALDSQNDTIKLVNVPQWDFHWQDFYFFKHIQKAPIGSVLHGEGVYDNTTANPNNPNPVWVYAGENTTDEMFLVYFHYMLYQNGDENYDLEALMNVGLQEMINSKSESDWFIAPNPFEEQVSIQFPHLKPGDQVKVAIYDFQGKLIKTLSSFSATTFSWDGSNQNGTKVAAGTYYVSANINGNFSSHILIKK